MYVAKNLNRGNNFKKFLKGKITKAESQLVSVSENHLEVFDFKIDHSLNISFLVLDFEQTFIFHIFDAEVFPFNLDIKC